MPFTFEKLHIPDVIVITPRIFKDNRGIFFESFKQSEFAANGIKEKFVQDNISKSTKGVLRGLHYQLNPHAQGKLVRCLSGSIFDVAVDIRKNSSTFGQWVGLELNNENQKMIYIPAGFAHGFYTNSQKAEVMYKVTSEYNSESERGILWNDKSLNVQWPTKRPILSEKDSLLKTLRETDIF